MYDYINPKNKQSGHSESKCSSNESQNQRPLANRPLGYTTPVIQRRLFSLNGGEEEIVDKTALANYLASTETAIRQSGLKEILINSSIKSRAFDNVTEAMGLLTRLATATLKKTETFYLNQYVDKFQYKIDITKVSADDVDDPEPPPVPLSLSRTGMFPKYSSKKRPPFPKTITDAITQYPTDYQNYPTSEGLKKSGLDQTHILSYGSAYEVLNSFLGNFSQIPEEDRPYALHTLKRLVASLGAHDLANEGIDKLFSNPLELLEHIERMASSGPEGALYPLVATIANNPANVGFGTASENKGIRERFDPHQYTGTDIFTYSTQVTKGNLENLEGVPQELIASALEQRRRRKTGELRHSTDVSMKKMKEMEEMEETIYAMEDINDERICDILHYGASHNVKSVRNIMNTGAELEAAVEIVRGLYAGVTINKPGGDCVLFTVRQYKQPALFKFPF